MVPWTLPAALIAGLGIPWVHRERGELADGSFHIFEVYSATVDWNGQRKRIEAHASDCALIGMELLRGCDVLIHVIPGGSVTIESFLES
jgi:predicted aspartyl protease